MANPPPNLESILATLAAAQQPRPSSTSQGGHPAPNPYPAQGPSYQAAPAYGYPAPSASGTFDLSAVKPVSSGTVALTDAVARAKAFAAQNGVTPYAQTTPYLSSETRPQENRSSRRSRSRSPPPRRDGFRENYNPYRDERREDRSHQSRDFGGDRFSPRGNHGGATRDRSPRGGNDDNSETLQIESSLVGLIIGRQGENLRRIEQETHCRVQFIPATNPSDQFRSCRITGPRARRAEASAAINRIIDDSGMGGLNSGAFDKNQDKSRVGGHSGGSQNPPPLKDGEDCLQIMVPDRTVGLIIGRGGETIRDLQERSGCHVNIVGENKSVNGLRPVNLIGSPANAMHAKDLIMEIVDSDSRNGNQGGHQGGNSRPARQENTQYGGGGQDKINDSIYVPSEAVGMIIGKGGETIREMQNNTGCKINVSQSSGPGEVEREIGLVGSRDSIERAKLAIEEKVEAVKAKSAGGGRNRGPPRDYDQPSYGSSSNSAAQNMPPAAQAPPGASGAADPYAAYGGYQAYLALWYQALANQQGQGQGDASKPPGAA